MDSLKSESCDPKDIVAQLQDSLQLDRAALVRAEHETKGVIRCLAERAKCANRLDVVQYLRKITPAGTTGKIVTGILNKDPDYKRPSPSPLFSQDHCSAS